MAKNWLSEQEYYVGISGFYGTRTAMELFQDNAEALLNAFIEQYPESPRARLAYYYLGKFMFREKNYNKAIASFEKVDQVAHVEAE